MLIILLVYIVVQLLTNAYAYAVIESVKPLIVKELHSRGYVENKNSLYNFNYTFSNILKGLIPFYYLRKAIKLVKKNRNIEDEANELINKGKYVLKDENKEIIRTFGEDKELNNTEDLSFETKKYTARKNDYSLFETYETPIDYKTRESTKEDNLHISPFIFEIKNSEPTSIKNETTFKDMAKRVCDLDIEDLEDFKKVIEELLKYKIDNNKKLKLEKDIAKNK